MIDQSATDDQQAGLHMQEERPRLLQPLPSDRSYDGVLRHYEVERDIARRLMIATREERTRIYKTMYDDLFAMVPDHPRLIRRADSQLTRSANARKMALVRSFIRPDGTFLEFGTGDCRFAFELARYAAHVIGIDISDQTDSATERPKNFELIVYDGYDLDLPDGVVDTAFSNQLIEHFHPDDTEHHFRIVHRILKVGGIYVFRTPHRLTGPHDVSRYFSDTPQGFHLKEWTYGELANLVRRVGFRGIRTYWYARGVRIRVPAKAFPAVEAVVGRLPRAWRRGPLRILLPGISMVAYK